MGRATWLNQLAEQTMETRLVCERLARQVEGATDRRRAALGPYKRARRLARSFMRRARDFQLVALRHGRELNEQAAVFRRLRQRCENAAWHFQGGPEPERLRHAREDLAMIERLIDQWATEAEDRQAGEGGAK